MRKGLGGSQRSGEDFTGEKGLKRKEKSEGICHLKHNVKSENHLTGGKGDWEFILEGIERGKS